MLTGGISSTGYTQDSSQIPGVAGSYGFRAAPGATWGDYYNYQAQQAYNAGNTLSGLLFDTQAKKSYSQPIFPVIGGSGGVSTYGMPAPTQPTTQLSGGILANSVPVGTVLAGTAPAPVSNSTVTNTKNMPVNVDYRPSATLVNNVDVPEFMNARRTPNLLEAFPNATAQQMPDSAWTGPSGNQTMSDLDSLLSGQQYPVPQQQQQYQPDQQPQPYQQPYQQPQPPALAPLENERAQMEQLQVQREQQPQAPNQTAYQIPNYYAPAGNAPPQPHPVPPQPYYPVQPQVPPVQQGNLNEDPAEYERRRRRGMPAEFTRMPPLKAQEKLSLPLKAAKFPPAQTLKAAKLPPAQTLKAAKLPPAQTLKPARIERQEIKPTRIERQQPQQGNQQPQLDPQGYQQSDQMPPLAPNRLAPQQPVMPPYQQQQQGNYPPQGNQQPQQGYQQPNPQQPELERQAEMLWNSVHNPEYMDAWHRNHLMGDYAYGQATQDVPDVQQIYAPGQRRPGMMGFLQNGMQNMAMLNPQVRDAYWQEYKNEMNRRQSAHDNAMQEKRQWGQMATNLVDSQFSQAGQTGRAFMKEIGDLVRAGQNQGGHITPNQLIEAGKWMAENYPVGPQRDAAIAAARSQNVDLSAWRDVPQSDKARTMQIGRETRNDSAQQSVNYRDAMYPMKLQEQQMRNERFRQTMPAYVAAQNTAAQLQQLKLQREQTYGDSMAQAELANKQNQLIKLQFTQLDTGRKQANAVVMQLETAQRNMFSAITPQAQAEAEKTFKGLGGFQALDDAVAARNAIMAQERELYQSLHSPQPAQAQNPMQEQQSKVTQLQPASPEQQRGFITQAKRENPNGTKEQIISRAQQLAKQAGYR